MRIIKNFKNRKIIKRIFKRKNNKLSNNELTTDNILEIDNEIIDDKVDITLSTLPSNETFLIDTKEINSNYQKDLSNPINYIHNEGQCICLFFFLLLYYASIIATKMKKSFEENSK